MGCQTLTSTVYGELKVSTDHEAAPNVQQLRAVCKVCHKVTALEIHGSANPFLSLTPEHEVGCRFHPDTVVPTAPAAPSQAPAGMPAASTLLPANPLFWPLVGAAGGAVGLLGYLLGTL